MLNYSQSSLLRDLNLNTIIDECQSAFMKGWHISNNVRLILDLIDHNDLLEDYNYILSVDYYKAFDTVAHCFLFETLDVFGFGESFKSAFQVMYKVCRSLDKLSTGTTRSSSVCRGIKQGDPAAPFLFLSVMQTMLLHVY